MTISATTLYNFVQCPTRAARDIQDDLADRDPINPFVAMLWERGTAYEQDVVENGGMAYLDLSGFEGEEKEQRTLEAMRAGEKLIYSGRIVSEDLVGVPDLLRRQGKSYVPIDIKSGRGEEDGGDDTDGKPKRHYAVQLALYIDILEKLGWSAGRFGSIYDIHGNEVEYDLNSTRGPRIKETLWDEYQAALASVRAIVEGFTRPKGALASACKLCHWHTSCRSELTAAGDLTLIPGLGRAARDSLAVEFSDVESLASIDPQAYVTEGKTPFAGVGEKSLDKFAARARLLSNPDAQPYLTQAVSLPSSELELFFDIEVDPLRDLTYLHGIVERRGRDKSTERFVSFFTDEETPDAERDAFAKAFTYLTADPTATIWYYSKYERTMYRKLQARYPEVCTADDIERLFNAERTVDLYYDVVFPATEWPTNDHSIKTLARYLGFEWRDTDPSGAASIEWFDQWVKSRDPDVKGRILQYNEDDCRATRVLLDGIRNL